MPAILAYAWSAHLILLGLRAWIATGSDSRALRALRLLGSTFPLLLPAVVVTAEAPTFWSHQPGLLVSPWVAWPTVLLWGGIVARNAVLIARQASTDRRLVGGAWRLDALAADPRIGYAHLAYRLGLRKAPPLMASREIGAPVLCGAFPPTILLPVAWVPPELVDFPEGAPWGAGRSRSPEELQAVLAHELAHVALRDPLRHLLDVLGALLLSLDPRPRPVPEGFFRRLARREVEAEEQAADRLAERLDPAFGPTLERLRAQLGVQPPAGPVAAPPGRIRALLGHGVLLGVLSLLLALAPGRADLGRAFGVDWPIPRRLPDGWVISSAIPQQVDYGFLPAAPGREATLHLRLGPGGACVLGHYTFVDRQILAGARRLEFEMAFDLEEGPLPRGTVAGFLLVPFDARDKSLFQSWVQARPADSVEHLQGRRHRFRNGLDLQGVRLEQIRDLWIEAQVSGPVHLDLHPPRLWVVRADGSRVPYGEGYLR